VEDDWQKHESTIEVNESNHRQLKNNQNREKKTHEYSGDDY
jgi:hypothetical protein